MLMAQQDENPQDTETPPAEDGERGGGWAIGGNREGQPQESGSSSPASEKDEDNGSEKDRG